MKYLLCVCCMQVWLFYTSHSKCIAFRRLATSLVFGSDSGSSWLLAAAWMNQMYHWQRSRLCGYIVSGTVSYLLCMFSQNRRRPNFSRESQIGLANLLPWPIAHELHSLLDEMLEICAGNVEKKKDFNRILICFINLCKWRRAAVWTGVLNCQPKHGHVGCM